MGETMDKIETDGETMDKIETALCIKDGYMNNGRRFCIRSLYYKYTFSLCEGDYPYSVKSEYTTNCDHSMRVDFFNEYFVKQKQLPDELFEI